jgi:hypothetical protein
VNHNSSDEAPERRMRIRPSETVDEFIQRLVAVAPALADEQLVHLRNLLGTLPAPSAESMAKLRRLLSPAPVAPFTDGVQQRRGKPGR